MRLSIQFNLVEVQASPRTAPEARLQGGEVPLGPVDPMFLVRIREGRSLATSQGAFLLQLRKELPNNTLSALGFPLKLRRGPPSLFVWAVTVVITGQRSHYFLASSEGKPSPGLTLSDPLRYLSTLLDLSRSPGVERPPTA